MATARIKTGTNVTVIAGEHKGQQGDILTVDREKQRVTVEGVNRQKKAMRRTQANPQGGISEIEGPIHISNVMPTEEYETRRQKSQSGEQKDNE